MISILLDKIGFSKTWFFNWPDASMDRCQEPGCGVRRKLHGRAHKFKEHGSKEKNND